MLAPIVIFAFNRPESLLRLLHSLKECPLFSQSEVFVNVDGPRNEYDKEKVTQTIKIAEGFTKNVVASKFNKGLAQSVIQGVSRILSKYGKAIVLEDDLVCMPGFLRYMNQMLDEYEDEKNVCSICGYGLKIRRPKNYMGDVYSSVRSSSWGWGTWQDRWESIDWDVRDYNDFKKDKKSRRSFNQGGSDMSSMLDGYMAHKNNSWAIRFCYWQWRNGKVSIHPFMSLVDNEGYGKDATNCRQTYSRFKIEREASLTKEQWAMPENVIPQSSITIQLARYHGIVIRMYSKIRKILGI